MPDQFDPYGVGCEDFDEWQEAWTEAEEEIESRVAPIKVGDRVWTHDEIIGDFNIPVIVADIVTIDKETKFDDGMTVTPSEEGKPIDVYRVKSPDKRIMTKIRGGLSTRRR